MKSFIKSRWMLVIVIALPFYSYAQISTRASNRGETVLVQHKNETNKTLAFGPDDTSEWIHYDNGCVNCDSWGFLINGEIYDVAAKWDPADLTNYDGYLITKVKFVVVTDNPIFKVKVWEGPSATEVYSQDIDPSEIIENSWTEITLDTPVEIDASTELWVGYYVDYTASELGGIVTATDDGPAVDNYGNLYRWNGNWYSDFSVNHNLQVLVESNLNANFESDITTVCEGGSVNFSNLSTGETSWLWTFEGGTPATSTEENPTVTYSTEGVYDVSLTVSDGQNNTTTTLNDYINVIITPGQPDVPVGDDELCSGLFYEYSTDPVDYASSYEWTVTPEDAGTFTGTGRIVNFGVSESFSGSFTINVRAWNVCDYGPWSDDFDGTIYLTPSEFEVSGYGEICEGDPGVEITLSGSEVGVDYELFKNEGTTGIIIAGTGEPISFGLFTEQNSYTAIGFTDYCSAAMVGEGSVLLLFLPAELTKPVGADEVCNYEENDYTTTNAQQSEDVIWTLSPEEAGTLISEGMTATITWNSSFEGNASLSAYAVNSCGAGPVSEILEIMVFASAEPEVSGDDLVCKNEVSVYSTGENSENNFTWEVVGGEITSGEGTAEISVTWGEVPGLGYVIVNEELPIGCPGVDTLAVVIDDCTGLSDNNIGTKVSLKPNPVSGNTLELLTGNTGISKVQIFSISGVLTSEYEMHGASLIMNIATLPGGLYFIKIIDENKNISSVKFVRN